MQSPGCLTIYDAYIHTIYYIYDLSTLSKSVVATVTGLVKKSWVRPGLEPRASGLPCQHSTTELPSHTVQTPSIFHQVPVPSQLNPVTLPTFTTTRVLVLPRKWRVERDLEHSKKRKETQSTINKQEKQQTNNRAKDAVVLSADKPAFAGCFLSIFLQKHCLNKYKH